MQEINVPKDKLAELYADPENNRKWMENVERSEQISGKSGMVGSKYRLVQKDGNTQRAFTATVLVRNLPDELKLILDSPSVQVTVKGKFIALTPERTKFISEEQFDFKNLSYKIGSFLVQRSIKKAHHKHMVAFKLFAERIYKNEQK